MIPYVTRSCKMSQKSHFDKRVKIYFFKYIYYFNFSLSYTLICDIYLYLHVTMETVAVNMIK